MPSWAWVVRWTLAGKADTTMGTRGFADVLPLQETPLIDPTLEVQHWHHSIYMQGWTVFHKLDLRIDLVCMLTHQLHGPLVGRYEVGFLYLAVFDDERLPILAPPGARGADPGR